MLLLMYFSYLCCRLMKNLAIEKTETGWSVSITSIIIWLYGVARWRKLRHGVKFDGYLDIKLTLDGRVVANKKPEIAFGMVGIDSKLQY